MNSDAAAYRGGGQGNRHPVEAEATPWHGQAWSIRVTPPLAALMLKPSGE
jgi:1,4-alpha-glucan branching enzyme